MSMPDYAVRTPLGQMWHLADEGTQKTYCGLLFVLGFDRVEPFEVSIGHDVCTRCSQARTVRGSRYASMSNEVSRTEPVTAGVSSPASRRLDG